MIEVLIYLNPKGKATKRKDKKLLGLICIANDGTGTSKLGNYNYAISHAGKFIDKKGVFKKGRIENFPRRLSPYRLVARILKDAGEK